MPGAETEGTTPTGVATMLSLGQSGRTAFFQIFRARVDRVTAVSRILLAAGGLYVTWLDSAHPPVSPLAVRSLLVIYLAYALLDAYTVWRSEVTRAGGSLFRHVVDLVFLAAIMHLSDGPSNPFTMFMPFLLMSATLNWRLKGAFWTAVACGAILALLVTTKTTETLDLDAYATADASLVLFMVVSAILLIWLGAHEDAVRSNLLRLVEKVPSVPTDRNWPAAVALDYAAHVMQSSQAVLLWSDGEEPWTYYASLSDGYTEVRTLSPGICPTWVAKELQNATLFAVNNVLIHKGEGCFDEWDGEAPLHPYLRHRFDGQPFVSVPFGIGELDARLFCIAPKRLTSDQVVLIEIVADRLRALFEQAILVRRLSEAAAVEERVRIGRDLHDGVLQALAGTVLQLESLREFAHAPDQLMARLAEIQKMLTDEQREFRTFVHMLRLNERRAENFDEQLVRPQLDMLEAKLRRQWQAELDIRVEPLDARLPGKLVSDLSGMISEAVANSVRHGKARAVTISIDVTDAAVKITVEDDGKGFSPQPGHCSIEPHSIAKRAASLGGKMSLHLRPVGTCVEVVLPLASIVR